MKEAPMESVIPHVITPQHAADSLGLTVAELAKNISTTAEETLHGLARKINAESNIRRARSTCSSNSSSVLISWALCCWKIVDAAAE
jgi:hypothetical protein